MIKCPKFTFIYNFAIWQNLITKKKGQLPFVCTSVNPDYARCVISTMFGWCFCFFKKKFFSNNCPWPLSVRSHCHRQTKWINTYMIGKEREIHLYISSHFHVSHQMEFLAMLFRTFWTQSPTKICKPNLSLFQIPFDQNGVCDS